MHNMIMVKMYLLIIFQFPRGLTGQILLALTALSFIYFQFPRGLTLLLQSRRRGTPVPFQFPRGLT